MNFHELCVQSVAGGVYAGFWLKVAKMREKTHKNYGFVKMAFFLLCLQFIRFFCVPCLLQRKGNPAGAYTYLCI